jgi:crotonobetainyl-CoA:carnitine CoA-transferase CaiB-like acyl-CoA transferase
MTDHALSGLRVLECGHLVSAAYATKLMADMGAEVVKIEEPGTGDRARRRGPFAGGAPHPEKSGLFLYLNTNKRGVTLDLRHPRGRALFDRLATTADVVVCNHPPDELAALGLTYERLRDLNPRLVVTSITPFGLDGPWSRYRATDLVLWNAGGVAFLNGGGPGSNDMPPLRAFGQQAGFQAGLNAAIATLAAVFARGRTGGGQRVEVSAQECVAAILELTFEFYPYMGLVASRLGARPLQPLAFMECRDGWIFVCCIEEHQWQRFVELMGTPEWATMELFQDRLARAANWDALALLLQEWVKDQSVDTLYQEAQRRRIPFAPVSTMGDLLASPHLRARGFFAEIAHPVAGTHRAPGAPCKLSATPWAIRRPAPCLGQHNAEILGGELGLDPAELAALATEHTI